MIIFISICKSLDPVKYFTKYENDAFCAGSELVMPVSFIILSLTDFKMESQASISHFRIRGMHRMSMKKKILTTGGVFLLGVIGGSALMYNNSVYDAVNNALGKGATHNAVAGANLSGLDPETAMLLVQSNRGKLLDAQYRDQLAAVQARSDQIAKLNAVVNALKSQLGQVPSDAKADHVIAPSADLTNAMNNAGVTEQLRTKGDMVTFLERIRSQIDSFHNSLQMDMLRLQSLMNKRNEGEPIMSLPPRNNNVDLGKMR